MVNKTRRTWVLSAIVVCGLSIAGVAAQRDGAAGQGAGRGGGGRGGGGGNAIPPSGAIQHIRDNLYKIQGAGSNTTVFVREDGVVLVDTKLANNGDAILKEVRTVTNKPVTMIINTHSHPDHNGSNDQIKAASTPNWVQVVAHENLKKAVTATQRPNPAMIPDITFTNYLRLGSGKDRIDLYYFGAGHTNNDAFVVFPSVRAMCIGDLMAWNMAPLIDPAAGGSVVALGETLAKAEKEIKGVDLVIEGHGNVNSWQGMRAYGDFMRTLVATARQGLAKKLTTEQALAELKKNSRFAVFLGTERLKELEYGDTPEHRALINLNVAYQELRGDPVTTYFGPPQSIGPEKGSAPPAAPRGGGAGRGGNANPGGGRQTPSAPPTPPDNR